MKKILSYIMAAVMILTLFIVPKYDSRAEGSYKLSINDKTHTYEAYQIFAGTLSSTGELSNITWGTGVNSAALLTAIKSSEDFGSPKPFASCESAEDVAGVLGNDDADSIFNGTDKDKYLAAFATIVSKNLSSTKKAGTAGTTSYDITGLEAGYYLVKDTTDVDGEEEKANSRFILNITEDTVIEAKPVVPELHKSILEDGAKKAANTASVGDKVEYQLDSYVPDMTGYNKYFFIVEDTLSAGLTFNEDVAIRIKGADDTWNTLTSPDKYTVSSDTDAGTGITTIKIVFKDFIDYQPAQGKPIEIKYSATLNEAAVIGGDGNPNEVKLIYSNDPTKTYVGKPGTPDEPGDDEPTGVTPTEKVITYTFQVKLTKVDGEDDSALAGAKFKIEGAGLSVYMITSVIYEKGTGAEYTYYKLKDGSYTTTAPTESTKDLYDSTSDTYKPVTTVTKGTKDLTTTNEAYVIGSGANKGIITFDRLGVGTYTITEVEAPEGYNKIDPFDVEITADFSGSEPVFKYTIADGDETTVNADGIITYSVVNNKGVVLPSTGGIGTTVFYVAGGILVLFAAVLLITKKRMEK